MVALANVSCSLSGEKDSLAYNYKNNRLHFQSHGIKGSCVNTTGILPKDSQFLVTSFQTVKYRLLHLLKHVNNFEI